MKKEKEYIVKPIKLKRELIEEVNSLIGKHNISISFFINQSVEKFLKNFKNRRQLLKDLKNKSTKEIEEELEYCCDSLIRKIKRKEFHKMYQIDLYLKEIRLYAKVLIKRSKKSNI